MEIPEKLKAFVQVIAIFLILILLAVLSMSLGPKSNGPPDHSSDASVSAAP